MEKRNFFEEYCALKDAEREELVEKLNGIEGNSKVFFDMKNDDYSKLYDCPCIIVEDGFNDGATSFYVTGVKCDGNGLSILGVDRDGDHVDEVDIYWDDIMPSQISIITNSI